MFDTVSIIKVNSTGKGSGRGISYGARQYKGYLREPPFIPPSKSRLSVAVDVTYDRYKPSKSRKFIEWGGRG